MKRLTFVLAVAAMVLGMAGSVPAASIVFTDSGNLGEFTFTNTGITNGTATIAVSVPSVLSSINTVNGAIVPPEPIRVTTPLNFTVTPVVSATGLYTVDLLGTITKTVGAVPGAQAIMGIDLTTGNTPLSLPNFFNATGPVTSLIANNNPLYDFSAFSSGQGRINFTFTATAFTGTSSFAGLFSTVGSTAVGNGSFSQVSPVPEPASMVTMGLGVIGIATGAYINRRRAKAKKATA